MAKSYHIDSARVTLVVLPDGTVEITEDLTFDFDGSFQGAYRDIPIRTGETVEEVVVSEGGITYSPGADTTLGSTDEPGSYGVEHLGSRIRVVWHYRAVDEQRTFRITYRMRGLAVAYDDVVDVNFKVWGDEWTVRADTVTSAVLLPGEPQPGEVLVWGHALGADGSTELGDDGVSPILQATGVPPNEFVEFRVVFPRSALSSTAGATVRQGEGLEAILAEEASFAARDEARAEQDRRERRSIFGWPLFLLPLPVAAWWGFRRYGSEPRVSYDREYEQSPPSDDPPAMVGALVSQGIAEEREFTATLFHLIRRGVLTAQPVSVERSTWGGLRREQISDLQIGLGDTSRSLRDFERSVVTVMNRVLDEGPQPLTELRKHIREDAAANAQTYQSFRSKVGDALERSSLVDTRGRVTGPALLVGIVLGVGAISWFALAPVFDGLLDMDTDVLRVGVVAATVVGAVGAIASGALPRMWVRRTPQGAHLDARWRAFRRYLEDFSRLEEAPPMALTLWEEYLVYGIALGVADDVLEAARLHAPEELSESSVYWYGDHGYGGHSSNAISGISNALDGAFRAPSSSSGGGGGFSGGGGGGAGGGGGGAW